MTKEEVVKKQCTEVRDLIELILREAKTPVSSTIHSADSLLSLWDYEARLYNLYEDDGSRRNSVHLPPVAPG